MLLLKMRGKCQKLIKNSFQRDCKLLQILLTNCLNTDFYMILVDTINYKQKCIGVMKFSFLEKYSLKYNHKVLLNICFYSAFSVLHCEAKYTHIIMYI